MTQGQNATDLAELLQDPQDSEISGSISWLFDNAWHAEIGCPPIRERNFETAAQAIRWLQITAIALYPNSPFSEKYRKVIGAD
jgi:hypothetical protein